MKLNTSFAIDTKANGYDCIQIIICKVMNNLTLILLPNCSEIPNS